RRIGNLELVAPEGVPDPVAYLILDRRPSLVVVDEALELVGHGELAEGDDLGHRIRLREHSRHRRRHLEKRALDAIRSIAIARVHPNPDRLDDHRQLEIVDRLLRDHAVREDEQVLVPRADLNGAPRHALDSPLRARADLDPIAEPDRLLRNEGEAGEEIRERVLKRETENDTA